MFVVGAVLCTPDPEVLVSPVVATPRSLEVVADGSCVFLVALEVSPSRARRARAAGSTSVSSFLACVACVVSAATGAATGAQTHRADFPSLLLVPMPRRSFPLHSGCSRYRSYPEIYKIVSVLWVK